MERFFQFLLITLTLFSSLSFCQQECPPLEEKEQKEQQKEKEEEEEGEYKGIIVGGELSDLLERSTPPTDSAPINQA